MFTINQTIQHNTCILFLCVLQSGSQPLVVTLVGTCQAQVTNKTLPSSIFTTLQLLLLKHIASCYMHPVLKEHCFLARALYTLHCNLQLRYVGSP